MIRIFKIKSLSLQHLYLYSSYPFPEGAKKKKKKNPSAVEHLSQQGALSPRIKPQTKIKAFSGKTGN